MSATAAVLALGLSAGTADAAETVAAPQAGAAQSQASISNPAVPSAEQLVAAARAKANEIVREVQSRISDHPRAIPPSEPAIPAKADPANATPASFVPAPSADAPGVAPVEVSTTDPPADPVADPLAPATAGPKDPPSTQTPGSTVLDESGGFRQAHRTPDVPRRSSQPQSSSSQAHVPVAAARPPLSTDRHADSPRRAHGHRPTPPPEDPGMPISAAPGSASGLVLGIALGSLLVLTTCKLPGAPRRRLAPPADRQFAPPFVPALERPG